MKKKLLLGSLCVLANLSFAQTSFTENNLVVYRYGSDVATAGVAVFLDEYEATATTAGGAVVKQTINVPTTTVTEAGVTNYRLRGIPKGGTNYLTEGYSSLSPDGKYLTIMGYDTPNGGGEAHDMVIGLIDKDGNINTSQTVSNANVARPRNAITNDGTGFWIAPPTAGTGVRYIANGGAPTGSTVVGNTSSLTSIRNLYIFDGQLYGSSGSNTFYTIGSGLPTDGTNTTVTAKALPGLGNNSQMVFFDVDGTITGPDLVYVADDVDGTNEGSKTARLRKYKYNGTDWLAKGSIEVPTLKSITATLVGDDVRLYGVTWGLPDGTKKSTLLKFIDVDAASSNIDALSSFLLAEAPTGTQFRGVTFTPGTTPITTLPVKLTSFTPKVQATGVLLNWSTASEMDNSHYEILRSGDGKKFDKIATVKGNGTVSTTSDYTYLDNNPSQGANYYKLSQFDLDGNITDSKVVFTNFTLNDISSNMTIFQTGENTLRLNITSKYIAKSDLKIINLSGQIIDEQTLFLEQGINNIDITKSFSTTGMYIAILSNSYELFKSKIIIK
ncbi:MAG TPA: T9SS type A sorting domain-containing protein [Pelobium sp.]|nr:T9SS type A sorting domain-containing protein [Pelobium sp.]